MDDQEFAQSKQDAAEIEKQRAEVGLSPISRKSLVEVTADGIYIFRSPHGAYGIQHLRVRRDYSHMIDRVIEGPFEDVVKDGRLILSGERLATARLSEILASLRI